MFNLVFSLVGFVVAVTAINVMTKSNLGRNGLSHLIGYSLSLGESRAGSQGGNLESGTEDHGGLLLIICFFQLVQPVFLSSPGLPA